MTIRTKLSLTIGSLLAGALITVFGALSWTIGRARQTELENTRRTQEQNVVLRLKGQVDVAAALVGAIAADPRHATPEEAQAAAAEAVRNLRFGEGRTAYFWIHRYDPADLTRATMVMHPSMPQIEGHELGDWVDLDRIEEVFFRGLIFPVGAPEVAHIKSTNLFIDMNRAVKEARDGEALVRYLWPKPTADGKATKAGYPKFSWVRDFPQWHWVIGTGEYVDQLEPAIAREEQALSERSREFARVLGLVAAGALLLMVAATWLVGRALARPIERLAAVSAALGAGDLSVEVPIDSSADELRALTTNFRGMAQKLRTQVDQIRRSAGGIGAAVNQMSSSSAQLAASSAQASESVARTAGTAEELRQSAAHASDRARSVTELMTTTAQQLPAGQAAVGAVLDRMSAIHVEMRTLGASVTQLDERSHAIGQITAAVDELAAQSSMLAVNAALEAARAGEQGRGFAVVAREIRALAEQSLRSTAQVRRLLTEIKGATTGAVQNSERVIAAVEAGLAQAGTANEAIGLMVKTAAEAAGAAGEIEKASQDQLAAINFTVEAMGMLKASTQQTAVTTRGLQAGAESLLQLGADLQALVRIYRV